MIHGGTLDPYKHNIPIGYGPKRGRRKWHDSNLDRQCRTNEFRATRKRARRLLKEMTSEGY